MKIKVLNFTNIPELAFKPIATQIKIVNDHFANICKKYPPLDSDINLNCPSNEKKLQIKTEFETYKLLNKYSKKALGPGDFPQKILQEFALWFATPFCDILNCFSPGYPRSVRLFSTTSTSERLGSTVVRSQGMHPCFRQHPSAEFYL